MTLNNAALLFVWKNCMLLVELQCCENNIAVVTRLRSVKLLVLVALVTRL